MAEDDHGIDWWASPPDTTSNKAAKADGRPDPLAEMTFTDTAVAAKVNIDDSAHERLSRFVYDMARRIEAHTTALPIDTTEGDFLEELMALFARAPLTQGYAARMAFGPPLDAATPRGTGPHKLIHEATGRWAYCGGRGLCRWCTEDVPS